MQCTDENKFIAVQCAFYAHDSKKYTAWLIGGPRFGECCYCSCLPLLPGLACSIHPTRGPPFSRALYCKFSSIAFHPDQIRLDDFRNFVYQSSGIASGQAASSEDKVSQRREGEIQLYYLILY